MKEFVAAGCQIAVRPNDPVANHAKIIYWMERARSEHGADLCVFPESVTTGFAPAMRPEVFWKLCEPIPGPFTDLVGQRCRELGMHVVLPVYEQGPEVGKIYNSSVLIDDEGAIVGVYRKTHLFPTERRTGGGWSTPGKAAEVYETRLGRIGLILCYDGDFPELSRSLAIQGAEIIVRPAAFLRSFEIWDLTNRARAYDNHVYMIAVNAVGPDAGRNYYFGHSQIISPIAQRLAQGRGTEEIISCTLCPDPLKWVSYGTRSPQIFDHLEDRNIAASQAHLHRPARSSFEPSQRIPNEDPDEK